MKKSLIAILVLSSLSLASLALAQEAGPAPGDCRGGRGHHGRHFSPEAMERRLSHLTERLSLDEHQVTLVREIFASARTEAEALRTAPGMAERSPERRAAFRALMESVGTRIDAVLNETQRAQFAAMRAERRARHSARRERREERREERGTGRGI
jgi:hypothetical protein